MSTANELYKKDFHAWCLSQCSLLALKRTDLLDWENLREELFSMGNREEHNLVNRLTQLFLHLLKWEYQPEKRSKSWIRSIENQRDEIFYLMKKNPSLKSCFEICKEDAYQLSVRMAARETGLSKKIFPGQFPYLSDPYLEEGWFPN